MAESFFFNVLVLLALAFVLGELLKRMKLPALIGHLLAGLIVGPSLFNIISTSEGFEILIDLSIFFLMFLAGLKLHPEEVKKAGKNAILLSILAFTIPFFASYYVMSLLEFDFLTSLFVALTLAITAIPVSAAVLMELKVLNTKIGSTIITAGIINDVLSLLVLAIILQIAAADTTTINYFDIANFVLKIGTFIGGIFVLDLVINKATPQLTNKAKNIFKKLNTREAGFAILLISTVGLAYLSESIGLHYVIGTFFAGLIIYRKIIGRDNFDKVNTVFSAITFGFFAPVFFAFIGTQLQISKVLEFSYLFVILFAIAVAGKIGGGFIGARLSGFSNKESSFIGYIMNGRGMVELVIATIGLEMGLVDTNLFSVIVAIAFITTLMAPVLARFSFAKIPKIK